MGTDEDIEDLKATVHTLSELVNMLAENQTRLMSLVEELSDHSSTEQVAEKVAAEFKESMDTPQHVTDPDEIARMFH